MAARDLWCILNDKISAKTKNPLGRVLHNGLIADMERFAEENNPHGYYHLLTRGAQVAKDPPAFESVEGITEDEKEAIRNEVIHKWSQPKALYFTIIICSIGAAVQGWDQTGSSGANLLFPCAFDISDAECGCDGTHPQHRFTKEPMVYEFDQCCPAHRLSFPWALDVRPTQQLLRPSWNIMSFFGTPY